MKEEKTDTSKHDLIVALYENEISFLTKFLDYIADNYPETDELITGVMESRGKLLERVAKEIRKRLRGKRK